MMNGLVAPRPSPCSADLVSTVMQLKVSLGQFISLHVLCVIIDYGTANYMEKAVHLARSYTAFCLVKKHGLHVIPKLAASHTQPHFYGTGKIMWICM